MLRRYRNGKDLAAKPRNVFAIDLFGFTHQEIRDEFPRIYQCVLERVKPERDLNNRPSYKTAWWIFGEPRSELRSALKGLRCFISTVETSRHRFFVFLAPDILPDNMLVNIAAEDSFLLGVLSSRSHLIWALASGGRLGVGNDPRYNKTRCFDPFPFPVCSGAQKARIKDLSESLDAHRKRQQELHPDLTLTGMYSVLEKIRSGEPLSSKERNIHEQGLISTLKQIHDELDAAVFDAYGWPRNLMDEEVLERLVALNAERAEEEQNGLVRWLRPEFQSPGHTNEEIQTILPGVEVLDNEIDTAPSLAVWPKKLPGQVSAVRDLLFGGHAWSVEQMAKSFKGAKRRNVESVLDSLTALGIAVSYKTPQGKRWRGIELGMVAA